MKSRLLAVWALWGVVAFAAILFALANSPGLKNAIAPRSLVGGPFQLTSARDGGIVDSRDLLGKPYGIFFGFTHCPEVCPTTLYEMSNAFDELKDDAKEFRLFFVTVDPERDTPELLKEFLSGFDQRIEGLIPTVEQLPILARSFHVVYEKVPSSEGGYTMNHTASVYLFNRQGEFQSSISYGEEHDVRLKKLRMVIQ